MNIDFDLIKDLKEKILEIYENSKKIKNINIENKEGNDIVTAIDLYMEKNIIKVIKEMFPEHSIYSEECGEERNESEYEWLIDPIDGTINFAAGIPLFSTSIALKKNDETINILKKEIEKRDDFLKDAIRMQTRLDKIIDATRSNKKKLDFRKVSSNENDFDSESFPKNELFEIVAAAKLLGKLSKESININEA